MYFTPAVVYAFPARHPVTSSQATSWPYVWDGKSSPRGWGMGFPPVYVYGTGTDFVAPLISGQEFYCRINHFIIA